MGTLVCSITFVALLVRVLYRIRATAMTQLLWDEWKLTKFAVARPTVAHHTLQPFRQVFRAFNGADSTSGCTQWRCCGSHLDNQSGFKTHCLSPIKILSDPAVWMDTFIYRGSIIEHRHYHRNNDYFLHHHHHNHHNSSELRMWFDVYINWNNLQ